MNIQETTKTQDDLYPVGTLTIELRDEQGNLKDFRHVKNTVMTNGKEFIAYSLLKTTTNSPIAMTHMAIGTDTTGSGDATKLSLVAQTGARVTFSTTASASTNTVQYQASFGASHSGVITEAGIFNASTGSGVAGGPVYMLCRTVFGAVTKTTSDTITITWTITVS